MVVASEVIAARAGWSRELARGQVLRLVDLEGRQAVDFLCYNAADPEDRYAAADTIKRVGSLVEENPADAVAIVRSWLADAA